MEDRGRILIGTSGWHYDHWQGPFYPETMASGDRLGFYAERFRAAEINNSFYQLPSADTLRSWRKTVPEGFVFAVKASRYITHMKKLKDPEEPVGHFLDRVKTLGDKLGPVLFQLPPNWRCSPERLEAFLDRLPQEGRYVFEFRDRSWFDDRIYELLRQTGAGCCIYDLAGFQSPRIMTADFVYLRLHGPEDAYEGCYDRSTLAGWAGACSTWARGGKDVYCFFDNDQEGYAARNALELAGMIGKQG